MTKTITLVIPPPHPAPFSDAILPIVESMLVPGSTVLDPFAGTGRIHELTTVNTFGVELEPEWASYHPDTIVANSLHLPYADGTFDAGATSPCYGNRMADAHNAQEVCRACDGSGDHIEGDNWKGWVITGPCPKCKGAGRRKYKRITYTHYLGRKLRRDNAGAMQWGHRYRVLHEGVYREVGRVIGDRFVVNMKDHVRGKKMVPVTRWHIDTLEAQGWRLVQDTPVETPGMGFGQNRDARAEYEHVLLFRR